MIVSKEPEKVEKGLTQEIGIGITIYKGVKGLGNTGEAEQKEIMHSVSSIELT